MTFEDIVVTVEDGVATIAINRPDNANKLRFQTARELLDAFRMVRETHDIDVAMLTGAGDKFFCIGGEHEELASLDYSSVMPVIDLYEFIDTMPKPVIAAVNGFAVGGGNVLHVVCDLAVAAPHAVFRQVGPMVGSFDAGYGTWYLEETIGRRRAKEMWYLNRKYTAEQALEMGLVNEIADDPVAHAARDRPDAPAARSFALSALKTAFSGRHTGVAGQARLAHDLLLTAYRAPRKRRRCRSPSRSAANPTERGSTSEFGQRRPQDFLEVVHEGRGSAADGPARADRCARRPDRDRPPGPRRRTRPTEPDALQWLTHTVRAAAQSSPSLAFVLAAGTPPTVRSTTRPSARTDVRARRRKSSRGGCDGARIRTPSSSSTWTTPIVWTSWPGTELSGRSPRGAHGAEEAAQLVSLTIPDAVAAPGRLRPPRP